MKQNTMKISPIQLYCKLHKIFGPQKWWPMDHAHHQQKQTDPRFEIMIGAILTQNTAWSNVENAIENMKKEDLLNIESLAKAEDHIIKSSIRPSGYYNQKAKRLQKLSRYLKEHYNADLNKFFSKSVQNLKKELLDLEGIGPETADSIILYASKKPVFVVDAYTKRLCKRIPFPIRSLRYNHIQKFFQDHLKKQFPDDKLVQIYNEYHALIVNLGKYYCKPRPHCSQCPIHARCNYGLEYSESDSE